MIYYWVIAQIAITNIKMHNHTKNKIISSNKMENLVQIINKNYLFQNLLEKKKVTMVT